MLGEQQYIMYFRKMANFNPRSKNFCRLKTQSARVCVFGTFFYIVILIILMSSGGEILFAKLKKFSTAKRSKLLFRRNSKKCAFCVEIIGPSVLFF